jgi:hypothetical protein
VGYYEQRPRDDREKPPGCLDALAITRAVFGVLVWPLAIMFLAMVDLGITFYLYATHPPLTLTPIVLTAIAIAVFARWERNHFRPPGP